MDPHPLARLSVPRSKADSSDKGKSSISVPRTTPSVTVLPPTASPSPEPAAPFVEILRLLRENESYKEYDTSEFQAMTSEVEELQQTMRAARKDTRLKLRTTEEQSHALHWDVSQAIPGVPPPQPLPSFVLTPPESALPDTGQARSGLGSEPPPPPSFVASSSQFISRSQFAPPARRGPRRFFGSLGHSQKGSSDF